MLGGREAGEEEEQFTGKRCLALKKSGMNRCRKHQEVLQSWKIFDWRRTTTKKKAELEEMEVAGI